MAKRSLTLKIVIIVTVLAMVVTALAPMLYSLGS